MTDLANRYGAPSPVRRRLMIAAVAALAVAALGWLAWVVVYQSTPEVHSGEATFTVVSDHEVTARITVVRKDTDVDATCSLRALAEDHAEVGVAKVTVDAGALRQDLTVSIRTERRATSVEMLGCTAPGQKQRR